jgi:hypothetical protein
MATETTTIRVRRETRDRLAKQAEKRGISLSALLNDIAGREEHAAIFKAEREAVAVDRANEAAEVEDDLWASTLSDGID